jgi:hypothetical protein
LCGLMPLFGLDDLYRRWFAAREACPPCGLAVAVGREACVAAVCIDCWYEMESGEELCPNCGARIDSDSSSYERLSVVGAQELAARPPGRDLQGSWTAREQNCCSAPRRSRQRSCASGPCRGITGISGNRRRIGDSCHRTSTVFPKPGSEKQRAKGAPNHTEYVP